MVSGLISLGGLIVEGVSSYFKTSQEIKKVKTEANKKIIIAEAEAKIKRLDREAEQDHDVNMEMIKRMDKSWKDEFVLLLVTSPFVMLFVPSLQDLAIKGLNALADTPFWYQVLVVGIFFTIYGMRDIFKVVLQVMISKLKGK